MTTPTLFKEYIWLVNTIHQARSITLSDINKKWLTTEMSGGVELARSTFNRHKIAIEDIFGIRIECERSKGLRQQKALHLYHLIREYKLFEWWD